MSGTTHVIISKCDILAESDVIKVKFSGDRFEPVTYMNMSDINDFEKQVEHWIRGYCETVREIKFSYSPKSI